MVSYTPVVPALTEPHSLREEAADQCFDGESPVEGVREDFLEEVASKLRPSKE